MAFPTYSNYDLEIANLARSVKDPRFRGGKPQWDGPDIVAYSGGVSRVYPIDLPTRTVALRCWVADVGCQRERYTCVSRHVRESGLQYFVDCEYIEGGILVQGREYPVIVMEWVDGTPLAEFIDHRAGDAASILRIADSFAEMVADLHRSRVAHGDLQDGNLIVSGRSGGPLLRLIDYDTMYVPALEGWSNDVTTVADYQHPRRVTEPSITEKDDYFSELVIYLSLRVIAEKPELWRVGQERRLLFTRKDFEDPDGSAIFHRTATLSREVQSLSWHLQQFCRAESIRELVPLEQVIREARRMAHTVTIPADFHTIFGNPRPDAPRPGSRGPITLDEVSPPPDREKSPGLSELDRIFKPVTLGPTEGPLKEPPAAPPPPRASYWLVVAIIAAFLIFLLIMMAFTRPVRP